MRLWVWVWVFLRACWRVRVVFPWQFPVALAICPFCVSCCFSEVVAVVVVVFVIVLMPLTAIAVASTPAPDMAKLLFPHPITIAQTSHPHVRGSEVADLLIGATFSQNFGRDGMWEGTVTKVSQRRGGSEQRSNLNREKAGGAAAKWQPREARWLDLFGV